VLTNVVRPVPDVPVRKLDEDVGERGKDGRRTDDHEG
jgi:hypothetical protein